MPDVLIIQPNPSVNLTIVSTPAQRTNDLIYTAGGGTIFGNTIKPDRVLGGNQLHEGNPVLTGLDIPIYKKEDKVSLKKTTIKVEGPNVERGLFIFRKSVGVTDPTSQVDGEYYWDEVYTTPIGVFSVVTPASLDPDDGITGPFQFYIYGNVMRIRTNDVNIIPKVNDYIVVQQVPAGTSLPDDVTDINSSFTDGYSNLPVFYNTESYQMKIRSVTIINSAGKNTEYSLVLDKSLGTTVGDLYSIVLLNRENTGLQKELFYDTFEQIEIHRSQLLGDSYFNTSLSSQPGRKNFLNYNSGQYLGLQSLLSGIINTKDQEFIETPFLVYDINQEIKDRFYTQQSLVGDTNFEFSLPLITVNENLNDDLNILTNYGTIKSEANGVGNYSGLYFKWDTSATNRLGWIFYDLRIIVIDDSELALALSYNSNRNYTLPKTITSVGNLNKNLTSNINFDVTNIVSSTGGGLYVIVNGNHGLLDGTAVVIEGVKSKDILTNAIKSSSANGIRYIKRYYSDPALSTGERTDRFYIYQDSFLSTAVTANGEFVNYGVGQSGSVKGDRLAYEYFYTYRLKSSKYTSILPQSEITSFNFAVSDTIINNTTGSLNITIPKFNKLNSGFTANQLEIIIGKWIADDATKPYKITGMEDVIVIASHETSTPWTSSTSSNLDLTIPKSLYNSLLSQVGNLGAYDYFTNRDGDTSYDLTNNFAHYAITSGSESPVLSTAEGKWTLGNIKYKTEIEQYRAELKVVVGAGEWNDSTNPTYDANNSFINEKYISEIAICDSNSTSDEPLIYTKISPPIKKTNDLDLVITLSLDF